MKFDSNLHREIWSLGDMTQTLCGNLPEKAAGVFRKEELARFERIVISGCGDSICAAYAVKECFEKLLKMVRRVPPLRSSSAFPARCRGLWRRPRGQRETEPSPWR